MNIQLSYGILTYISFFCFPLLAQNHFYVAAFCLLVFLSFVLCLLCNSLASNYASQPSIYTCCYVITSAWVKDINISREEIGSQHNDSIHHFYYPCSNINQLYSLIFNGNSASSCHRQVTIHVMICLGEFYPEDIYAVYCLELPFFSLFQQYLLELVLHPCKVKKMDLHPCMVKKIDLHPCMVKKMDLS